jgi:hypothetical protein
VIPRGLTDLMDLATEDFQGSFKATTGRHLQLIMGLIKVTYRSEKLGLFYCHNITVLLLI